jgi:hypothetical protein
VGAVGNYLFLALRETGEEFMKETAQSFVAIDCIGAITIDCASVFWIYI